MNRHTRTLLAWMLAALFAWVADRPAPAAAVTVNFDAGSGIAFTYTENGISVASDVAGFYVKLGDNDGNASPDVANNPGCCSTPYRFTYSGGVFSVGKWDFNLISGTHTFTASSGDVFSPGSGTVSPPAAGWTGITYFTWNAAGVATDKAVMDNLKFCPGDCNDGNPCTTDSCDPDSGGADGNGCIHTGNSAPCSDGLFCNGADTCGGGTCSLHAGDPCTGGAECANACNEALDNCSVTAGTACTDDGNVCTNDQCDGAGSCVHPNNSAPCSDGTFCNGADTCSGGSCVLHAGDPCAGGSECANLCNEGAQNCFRPGSALCTSDGNVCTDDHCDGAGACVHPDNTAPCNDSSVCTTVDQCSGGSCGGSSPLNCDDNIQCTLDSCDPMNGCQHDTTALNGQSCNDSNSCTDPDTCNNGTCSGPSLPQNCNDGNPCTLDSCNPLGGCSHDAAALDGVACDDNNTCTQNDACDGGVCHGVLTEADTDGDGFCDRVENDASCNPNDAAEIPPQSLAFAGAPGLGQGEGIIAYHVPGFEKIIVADDPSCAAAGACGPIGFCTAGKISDPCTVSSDCDQPPNTCTVVVNWGNVDALTFIYAKMNHTVLSGFTPATRGCSRKVQVPLDTARLVNRLKLKASGTLLGRARRDRDRFQFFGP